MVVIDTFSRRCLDPSAEHGLSVNDLIVFTTDGGGVDSYDTSTIM